MNASEIANIHIPVPPDSEQKAIAEFLDHRTAAIDTLIEKKEHLVALLAEKRAALIQRAVSRGLDPDAPMKDSGVPWIGEIPAHWGVKRLKHISPRLAGRLVVQPHLYFEDEGVPIVFGYNIRRGKIDLKGLSKIGFAADLRHAHCRVRSGDLLTVRVGDPGMTAVVPPELDGCHFASAMLIRRAPSFDSGWLCHAMNSALVQEQIEAANYGAAQKQFNIGEAANFRIAVPPMREQVKITRYLDARLALMDDLANSIHRQNDLLREHRQSLITAAVTGQIDVRSDSMAGEAVS